jgi:PAS domain-containing protein
MARNAKNDLLSRDRSAIFRHLLLRSLPRQHHFRCPAHSGNWEDTFPLRSKDGTYRWFLSRALPIRNEAGGIVCWFGTNTDITQQIEAESALRELNATLEQRVKAETQERLHIWNVSQDLLVVADLEGKYLSVNPAWTATLGWSEAELLDRSSQWLLHPDDQEKRMPRYATLPRAERQCVLRAVSAIGMALIDGFLGKPYPTGGDFTPWAGTLQNSKMPRMNCEKPGGNLHSLRDALPWMRCRLQSPMKSNSHLITCDAFKGGRE